MSTAATDPSTSTTVPTPTPTSTPISSDVTAPVSNVASSSLPRTNASADTAAAMPSALSAQAQVEHLPAPEGQLNSLLDHMFAQCNAYIRSEILSSVEDYECLTKLNLHASKKYEMLAEKSQRLMSILTTMHSTYASLQPYLEQIDALDSQLEVLESLVTQLDDHSKRLYDAFKLLYK